MEDEREVRREDAAALAKFYNISYIETSSMRGINVEEAFRTITQEVYDKVSSSSPPFLLESPEGKGTTRYPPDEVVQAVTGTGLKAGEAAGMLPVGG